VRPRLLLIGCAALALAGCFHDEVGSREEAEQRAVELLEARGLGVRSCNMNPALDDARAFASGQFFCTLNEPRDGSPRWCFLAVETDDRDLPVRLSEGIPAAQGCA
jgi:hypothetical protein